MSVGKAKVHFCYSEKILKVRKSDLHKGSAQPCYDTSFIAFARILFSLPHHHSRPNFKYKAAKESGRECPLQTLI